MHLLDNPEATPDDLMEFVKGPDFPTGGLIMGRAGILDAYRTGKGSIRLRAEAEIEEGPRSDRIVVTELPYQVSPNQFITKLSELVNTRELEGIADLNDESSGKTGMRIIVKLKRDAPALRDPEQPLQAHAAADQLRGQHGGARRRRAPHAQPARRAAWPTSTTRSRSSPGARSSGSTRRRTGPTSSRACSRRST